MLDHSREFFVNTECVSCQEPMADPKHIPVIFLRQREPSPGAMRVKVLLHHMKEVVASSPDLSNDVQAEQEHTPWKKDSASLRFRMCKSMASEHAMQCVIVQGNAL